MRRGKAPHFSQESIPPPIPRDGHPSEADRSSCHRVLSASPCSLCLSSVPSVLSLFFSHRSLAPSSVGDSPALLAVQSSNSSVPCKTLNHFIPSCYPALCSLLRSLKLLPFLPLYMSWVYLACPRPAEKLLGVPPGLRLPP